MKRVAVVDPKLCKPEKCGLACVKVCPVNRMNKDCITLPEERKTVLISEDLCTGCGICPKICPFHAITIVNLVAPVEEKLVYQYGENLFKQYGMVLPKKGIVGVIGENGTGKSTNVKLLAGKLLPQKTPTVEIKTYFEKKEFENVVTKFQEIAAFKGKVKELLEKANKNNLLNELEKTFDLQRLYERDLTELSGGELQQVAITATLCQEKELYILDEPFAFLDYVYRIRLVNFLREHFSEKKVILIDHDISLMSYVCDLTYILFGHPGAYGIASQPYGSDRSINMFLDGFIQPENVKFRSSAVHYKQFLEEKKTLALEQLPTFEFEQGSFKLKNGKDIKIKKGEVIGIAGPNGIGKSTFCKILKEKLALPTAIKPQVLERKNELVGEFLKPKNNFAMRYLNEMNLRKFEFYYSNNLSGGELQKYEVFKALNDEKEIYILDEPTTMMDVIGRIQLAKLLKEYANEGKTIIIVDHDLEFLLNTVDRIIVMDGTPSKEGFVTGIHSKDEGILELMRKFDLSYRRDPLSKRLKLNKKGSKKDVELKERGTFIEN